MKSVSRQKAHDKLTLLLRELRLKAGLKQSEVATLLRRPQSYVSKYESGERRLDLIELQEICKVLNIKLGELVENFERKTREA